MSTICLLDPTVRRQRAERSALVAGFSQVAPRLLKEGFSARAIRARVVYLRLKAIHDNPRLTGATKERMFNQLERLGRA